MTLAAEHATSDGRCLYSRPSDVLGSRNKYIRMDEYSGRSFDRPVLQATYSTLFCRTVKVSAIRDAAERARGRDNVTHRRVATSLYCSSSEISTTTTTTICESAARLGTSSTASRRPSRQLGVGSRHTFWSIPLTSGLARFGIARVAKGHRYTITQFREVQAPKPNVNRRFSLHAEFQQQSV